MGDSTNVPSRISRRRLMRQGVTLVSGIAAGSILAACGGAIPTAAPSSATPATSGASTISGSAAPAVQSSPNGSAVAARKGGTAVYYASQEGSHLIPSFSSFSTVIAPTAPFFNGLTKPGLNLEPLPDLAESWTSTPDGKQWTFKLRTGVKWHDGQPFTAADVKFTWETIAHPDNKTGAQLYSFFALVAGAQCGAGGPNYNFLLGDFFQACRPLIELAPRALIRQWIGQYGREAPEIPVDRR